MFVGFRGRITEDKFKIHLSHGPNISHTHAHPHTAAQRERVTSIFFLSKQEGYGDKIKIRAVGCNCLVDLFQKLSLSHQGSNFQFVTQK